MEQNGTALVLVVTQNWREKPVISHEVILNLITATTTKTGLRVGFQLDDNPSGAKVSKAEIATINIHTDTFHG